MTLTSLIYTHQKSLGNHCYLIVLGNETAYINKREMKGHMMDSKRI